MPALLLVLLSCSTSSGEKYSATSVIGISIDPGDMTLQTTPDAPATQLFVAMAQFDDGSTAALDEDLVEWSTSNESAGTLDREGLFTASATNGGVTSITAEHAGLSASATLTVLYSDTYGSSSSGLSAADFDGDAAGELAWIYPPDTVSVPRNVPSLGFFCEEVAGAEGYRFSFSTPTTAISALSDTHSWEATGDEWVTIAAANADADVSVECRAKVGDQVYVSAPLSIHVDRMDALGSIYYWSTTDLGIMKVPFSADEADVYYAPATGSGKCVGCHVVTEDRMAVVYGASDSDFFVGITDTSTGDPEELTDQSQQGAYVAMRPDGEIMITSTASGTLMAFDARTGSALGAVNGGGKKLTMPSWSPDGDRIAMIEADDLTGCDSCFSRGHVVVADVSDDGLSLSNFVTLVEPEQTYDVTTQINVYYPAFSPDGDWIVYNQGIGNSYYNPLSQLWVVSAEGGDPIELATANQGENLCNSWPHWGPLPDDDVYWITYSSLRPYADVVTDGSPQIWVTSFSPEKAAEGLDPSTPAFWLANQDPDTANHSTYWGPE